MNLLIFLDNFPVTFKATSERSQKNNTRSQELNSISEIFTSSIGDPFNGNELLHVKCRQEFNVI